MQDKLKKILQIKIDAINKNIENLNYLNGELDNNNESLNYIKEKILLFKNNELLNFDQITKEDFEKIISMINPNVANVFNDKACSYDGIIYIIEGIRKSISLQLTTEQVNAILAFVEGMKIKSLNLEEVINNLIESKENLQETDLSILNDNLKNYEDIVSKFENNLYLTEIDDIEEALNFGDVSIEEKVDLFEYLLKYNADIYNTKIIEEEKEEYKEIDNTFDIPTFNHEPLNINIDEEPKQDDNVVLNNYEPEVERDVPTFDNIKYDTNTELEENVETNTENNNMESHEMFEQQIDNEMEADVKEDDNLNETNQVNTIPEIDTPLPTIDSMTFPSIDTLNIANQIPEENKDDVNEINTTEDSHELNTVELEDIIKKIDARLKEMEPTEEEKTENNEVEIPTQSFNEFKNDIIDYSDVLSKYALPEINITNNNKDDVEYILELLNNNKVLDNLKNNKEVLRNILSNCSKSKMDEIISLINDNLLVKEDEFEYILNIMLQTMPLLFTRDDVLESFKLNLEFFKEKKLNIINLFDNYRELLIMNNDVLKDNYKKVEQYGLEINNDNVKYYLYNRNIAKNIDSYIEAVGYEKGFLGRDDHFDGIEYIKKNPYKLNEINKNTLMKLRYSSENNQKIYGNKPGILSGEISNPKVDIISLSDEYTNTYFNGNYSMIDKNEYQNLKKEIDELKDYDLTTDEVIQKLDNKYKNGELRYKFNNVLISRMKTIRLYNFLKNKNLSLKDALLIALTYNTVLKNDEYSEIEKIAEKVVEGGK